MGTTSSWLTTLRNNGVTRASSYGRFIGARYAGKVMWLHGNDFESWRNATDDALVTAVRDGIKAADPAGLHTIELNYEVNNVITASASRDDANWENRVDVNGVYTYNPTYAKFLSEYAKAPTKPTFLIEGQYENANFDVSHTVTTPFAVRRQNWWASTSGATGLFYSDFTFVNPTAASYLASSYATTGSSELGYLSSFLRSFAWQTLVPDTGHTFVTGGLGTYASTGDPNYNDYATAAVTPTGIGVAYMPTARTITVNFAAFGANPTVQWFDPTTNTYSSVAGPFSSLQSLTPPGSHADGSSDWVLVVHRN
jgi:hypothetical protein